jgi:hypothetical protein
MTMSAHRGYDHRHNGREDRGLGHDGRGSGRKPMNAALLVPPEGSNGPPGFVFPQSQQLRFTIEAIRQPTT